MSREDYVRLSILSLWWRPSFTDYEEESSLRNVDDKETHLVRN